MNHFIILFYDDTNITSIYEISVQLRCYDESTKCHFTFFLARDGCDVTSFGINEYHRFRNDKILHNWFICVDDDLDAIHNSLFYQFMHDFSSDVNFDEVRNKLCRNFVKNSRLSIFTNFAFFRIH